MAGKYGNKIKDTVKYLNLRFLGLKKELTAVDAALRYYVNLRYSNKALEESIWKKKYSHNLLKFKDIHQGEDCFIIGNGPSLNKINIDALNDYHAFGMNKIYLIFERCHLRLSYYLAVNRLVIEQSVREINKLHMPVFLSHQKSCDLLRDIHADVYTLDTEAGRGVFGETLTKKIAEGHTVTYVAMQVAYFMGFKRVFLVGVDHDFVQSGNPNEEQLCEGEDINHFDPRYFSGQKWQLADLGEAEFHYRLARLFYESRGRKIFDATVGGKLDVFEKISFEEALKIARKREGSNA